VASGEGGDDGPVRQDARAVVVDDERQAARSAQTPRADPPQRAHLVREGPDVGRHVVLEPAELTELLSLGELASLFRECPTGRALGRHVGQCGHCTQHLAVGTDDLAAVHDDLAPGPAQWTDQDVLVGDVLTAQGPHQRVLGRAQPPPRDVEHVDQGRQVLRREALEARGEAEHRALRTVAHHEHAVGVAGHDPDLDGLQERIREALPAAELRMDLGQLGQGAIEGVRGAVTPRQVKPPERDEDGDADRRDGHHPQQRDQVTTREERRDDDGGKTDDDRDEGDADPPAEHAASRHVGDRSLVRLLHATCLPTGRRVTPTRTCVRRAARRAAGQRVHGRSVPRRAG